MKSFFRQWAVTLIALTLLIIIPTLVAIYEQSLSVFYKFWWAFPLVIGILVIEKLLEGKKGRQFLVKQLNIPLHYTEISLYLMSISFLLLFAFNTGLWKELTLVFDASAEARNGRKLILWIFFAFIGAIYSIFHILSTDKKDKFAQYYMEAFGVVITLGSSISAGIYILGSRPWYLGIPAILTLLHAVLILSLHKQKKLSVSQKNARWGEVIIGSTAVLLIFLFSNYILQAHWSITFSSCVFYALFLNENTKRLFPSFHKRWSYSGWDTPDIFQKQIHLGKKINVLLVAITVLAFILFHKILSVFANNFF